MEMSPPTLPVDNLATANMKNLKDFEMHSINSLAARLNLMVSRTTLQKWIDSGLLKPALQHRGCRNSHVLFHKKKLDELAKILERGFTERVNRLAGRCNSKAIQYKQAAISNALRVFEQNKKRRAAGLKEAAEKGLAECDDAARGVVRLTNDPALEKKIYRVFGGFGKWKK